MAIYQNKSTSSSVIRLGIKNSGSVLPPSVGGEGRKIPCYYATATILGSQPQLPTFLFPFFTTLLWLLFKLFPGFIVELSGKEQVEMSLCHLVQTGSLCLLFFFFFKWNMFLSVLICKG